MKNDSDVTKRLNEIFQSWNKSDAPGLVVGVALKGQAIYRRGFGLSSVEHGTANTPRTRMRIGSTSKHFTSIAALLLAEQGKLDIDVPVRTYLPELAGPAGEPTLRQFMHHSSGLRDPYDLPGVFLHRRFPHMVGSGMGMEMSQRFSSENFAPGERMIYCNNGYHLLSIVIERVSGEVFETFLKRHIFDPLGLNDTESLRSDMRMIPGIASLHLPQPDGSYVRGIYPSEELFGSGAMVSTIDDMLNWLSHLRGEKKIGNKHSWKQMLEKPRYSSGAISDYCLGLSRESYRGVEIIHHAGAVLGGTCQMLTVPEHALDIIIICNRMDGNASALALQVIDAVLEKSALAPAETPQPAAKWKTLQGLWYSPRSRRVIGVVPQVTAPGAKPVLALSIHNTRAGILKKSAGKLVMTSPAHGTVELHIPKNADKPLKTLDISDSGHRERYVRLPQKVRKVRHAFRDLCGHYRYTDFGVDVALIEERGTLYLDLLPNYGQERFKLEALSDSVFAGSLLSSAFLPLPATVTVAVERSDDGIKGLWVSGMRTRNLWLERCD